MGEEREEERGERCNSFLSRIGFPDHRGRDCERRRADDDDRSRRGHGRGRFLYI
jgi:hypothetical protein